jgi:hypothetical protein
MRNRSGSGRPGAGAAVPHALHPLTEFLLHHSLQISDETSRDMRETMEGQEPPKIVKYCLL